MKKINCKMYYFLFFLIININNVLLANDLNLKNSWLYEFNPQLINEIQIQKQNTGTDYINFIYKNKKQNIDNFSKDCNNIKLKQKSDENLIYKLPDACNISFVDSVKFNETQSLIIYLCNNKGCEKIDKYSVCIEDNYDDCGF